MSTSPNNYPSLEGATGLTTFKRDFSWLQHHLVVSVLALVLAAALVYGSVNFVDKIITAHDEKKDALIEKVLASKEAAQQQLLAKMADDKAASDARDAAKDAEIQSLVTQMQADHAALADRLKKNSTLDAAGAAARLVEQEHANPTQVKAQGDAVLVDLPLTRQIVSDLDKGQQAAKDVVNLGAQLDAQKVITDDAKKNFENAQKVIAADKDTLIAQIQADNAACKVAVDKERDKGNKKGFWGYVAGVATFIIFRH